METVLEDFSEELRQALEPAIRNFFSREFVICSVHFERFTTEIAGASLERLGLLPDFEEFTLPSEALSRRGYVERARVGLEWMLAQLSEAGFFEWKETAQGRLYRARVPIPPAQSHAREKAMAVDPACAPSFRVVEELSPNVVDFFEGKKTGEEIFFSPAKLMLWFDYFSNDNLLYAVNNRLGAEAVTRVLPATRPSTVLEIGGGCGSAALALLERLEADGRLGNVEKYLFTEAVPTFLRRGERALRQKFPGVALEARKLDMNVSLVEQGIAPASVDVAYAVNTVHVAKNLLRALEGIRDVLKPGGHLVISECVRPRADQPVYAEFIFNFLENFVDVVKDPEYRPTHGFLTPSHWRSAFLKSGFDKVEILPDVEALAKRFPSFFVAAISARKPAA
jgi:SAM-dependent methyltransferase